jgi:hypothetical protein
MEHGLDTEAVVVDTACVVIWGLVASRLGRWSITAPLAFVAFGLDNRLTDRLDEDHFFPTVSRAVEWCSASSPED